MSVEAITEEERDELRWKLQRRVYDDDGTPNVETEAEWWARLADMLPNDMGADWVGTNHYELNSEEVTINGIRWGCCRGIGPQDGHKDLSGTEFGQMLGLVMEAACAFKPVLAALTAAEARNKELEEALEPFAKLEFHTDDPAAVVQFRVIEKGIGHATVGDFRRARSVYGGE